MSKNKKSVPERIVVDHKKLEKLRKSLTKTIDEFKSSVLERLEVQDEGPLKEGLRDDVKPPKAVAAVDDLSIKVGDVVVKQPEDHVDLGLEQWIAQGMPKVAQSLPEQSVVAEAPAQVIQIIKPSIEQETTVMTAANLEQWVNKEEPSRIKDSLASFVDKVAVAQVTGELRAANSHVFFTGLDNLVSSNVRNFLQKIGMRTFLPSLLNQHTRPILEHFKEYGDFEFAVVVLSPDELMFQRLQDPKNALWVTSQKTVFELGFLVGKLGRNRVVVFYEDVDKFKRPTEFFDLNYIAYDAQGQWQQQLIGHMKTAGISIKEEASVAV